MLHTNLDHIESDKAFDELVQNEKEIMICCGREGPMCLPVYDVMENLRDRYPDVAFRDMSFDGRAAHNIKSLPQAKGFMGLPFTVYIRDGEVVEATSGIQNKSQVKGILDRVFGEAVRKVA